MRNLLASRPLCCLPFHSVLQAIAPSYDGLEAFASLLPESPGRDFAVVIIRRTTSATSVVPPPLPLATAKLYIPKAAHRATTSVGAQPYEVFAVCFVARARSDFFVLRTSLQLIGHAAAGRSGRRPPQHCKNPLEAFLHPHPNLCGRFHPARVLRYRCTLLVRLAVLKYHHMLYCLSNLVTSNSEIVPSAYDGF